MDALVRVAYWLGWIFFALAVLGRGLFFTSLKERIIETGVLPHNAFQLALLFFIISIATALYNRETS